MEKLGTSDHKIAQMKARGSQTEVYVDVRAKPLFTTSALNWVDAFIINQITNITQPPTRDYRKPNKREMDT